jgi:gluconokinase
LREAIVAWLAAGKSVVLACSALKRSYREKLLLDPQVRFVYLRGSAALIADRLRSRYGHFAGGSILASQLADLEEPETAITVDISDTPKQIVAEIKRALTME